MIRKMYDRIYRKLELNSALRDSDRLLMLDIWRDEGFVLSATQERKFMTVSAPETIRRTRQKIQNDGYFRSSQRVQDFKNINQSHVVSEVTHDRIVQSEMFQDGKRFPV